LVLLLELARGIAALWVFLAHAKDLFVNSSPFIYHIALYGALGVPMFFVISGYVITFSAESSLKNNKPPVFFLKNRALRIYPTFWASVVIVLLTPYLIEAISALKTGEYSEPDSVVSKLNTGEWLNLLVLTKVFWATSTDLQGQFNMINAVYWTLAVEFQFYVVVFLALYFRRHYWKVIFLISMAGFIIMFIPTGMNYGLFIHYWPSFSIGIGLAYLHRHGIRYEAYFKNNSIYLILLMAVIIWVARLPFPEATKNYKFFLFSIGFGLLLWSIADFETVLTKVKLSGNKLLYWLLEPWLILGAMSYSVYLLHGKIYLLPFMLVRQFLNSNNFLYGFLTVLGTLMMCFPFYYYIERRFLSKNYKKLHQKVLTK